jgi:hypothetical protein
MRATGWSVMRWCCRAPWSNSMNRRSQANQSRPKITNPFQSNSYGLPGVFPVRNSTRPSGIITSQGYDMPASPKTAPRRNSCTLRSTKDASCSPQMGVMSPVEQKIEKCRHAVMAVNLLILPSSTRSGSAAGTHAPHHHATKRTQFSPPSHPALAFDSRPPIRLLREAAL